jgi:uncharacterized membrane protein
MDPTQSKHDGTDGGHSGRQPNRRLNSLFFVLGATVANILVMLGLIILLLFLYGRFLAPVMSQAASQIAVVVILFVSVAATYFFYHQFIKWLSGRVEMDRYFDPIFRIGRKK